MTAPPDDPIAHIRGQLDLILWRLNQIELERQDDERFRRQIMTAVSVAVLTALLGLLLPMVGAR